MGKWDQGVWLRMEEIVDEFGKGGRMVDGRVAFNVLELEVEVTRSSEYILPGVFFAVLPVSRGWCLVELFTALKVELRLI